MRDVILRGAVQYDEQAFYHGNHCQHCAVWKDQERVKRRAEQSRQGLGWR